MVQTQAELRERREQVRKLLERGFDADEIANRFGVTKRTIYNDLRALSKKMAKELEKINWKSEIRRSWGIFDTALKRLERRYYYLLKKEEEGENVTRDIIAVIDRLLKVANEKIKAMQAFGVLPREPIVINQNNLTLNIETMEKALSEANELIEEVYKK